MNISTLRTLFFNMLFLWQAYDDVGHEAKFLSCHHSFCSECLSHLAMKTREYIECPSCRAHTSLTETGTCPEYIRPAGLILPSVRQVRVSPSICPQ